MSKQCTLAAKEANSIWGALQRLLPALLEHCEQRLFPGVHSALVRHVWGSVVGSGLCRNKKVGDVLDQECGKGPFKLITGLEPLHVRRG